jgi:hypothetical protein
MEQGVSIMRLITVKQTKRDYGYSHSGLYRELSAGHIHAIKRGRTTLLDADEIEARHASLPKAEFRATAKAA